MMERTDRRREGRHDGTVEEWVFAAWSPTADLGVLSGHRLVGRNAWYWAALARADHELLHVADFEVPVRPDPFVIKGEALWAEHVCDAAFEQWSIGNETYAAALADPAEALGRAYGTPTPIAFDLEWYATCPPADLPPGSSGEEGYHQRGVVHGVIEVLGEPAVELEEVPGERWHRWVGADPTDLPAMGPIALPPVVAHSGVRAPFRFPDGTRADLVLTADGWRTRASAFS